MQRLVIVFVSLVLIGTVKCNWQLVWSDEFNGNHLDENNWKYHTGVHKRNHELEFYTSHRHENVRVENGHLVIEARPEEYQGSNFTSGRLDGKKAWTYGKFEARAKLPSGHNLWPAIWMMPRDSKYGIWAASGEIDIMEFRGDKPHEIMGTIHYGGTWPDNISSTSGVRHYKHDFSQDYHTFALEWEQKRFVALAGTVRCNWQLVWSDEFNGNDLDENNWKYHTGVHKQSHELEFYTSHRHENVRVENGNLVIEARPEEYQGSNFTSGRLNGK
ncbi:hypothetical protein RDWZM_005648 [Blomia tropicalis]|uniref:GH16 domain-containing protein n=1 Tax=Blomia tropicalis TaxID=40697 RepID=A0A9Q0RNM3_BLOTA|nr:hypothetical protein RDWZM_005648 [Blomia tropicalis]